MAVKDLTIPVGDGGDRHIVVGLSDAGEVEIRQGGATITIGQERRTELVDALVVAYRAVDHMARRAQPRRDQEGRDDT